MPKGSKAKPRSSSKAVEGKTTRSGVQTARAAVAGKRGDGKRLRGLAAVDPPAVLVQPDEPESANVPLISGWAEKLGKAIGKQEAEVNGKTKKAFVRSPEMRMKMKLAQRARRAREHQEAR